MKNTAFALYLAYDQNIIFSIGPIDTSNHTQKLNNIGSIVEYGNGICLVCC